MILPADPERRLALAYVPAARRPALAAIWALDERLAGIVAATREPMIGRIRLAWWRDALAALDDAAPPAEPLLVALAAEVLPTVSGAGMAAMVAGWDALLPLDAVDEAALESHAEERGERLFALSGRLLGGAPPAGAGAMWARADLVRAILPGTGRGTARSVVEGTLHERDRKRRPPSTSFAGPPPRAGEDRWPRTIRPLGMLAVLARRDPAERPGSPARILAMLRHRLTGR